ncbi:MAG: hypothetical protein J6J62_05800, partial [Oscillospiraceae bacterium]|nr:hypothetical protein [Oscillospiraceae bacterium]
SPAVSLSYGQRLLNSFKDGLHSVADFFSDFLLWFVAAFPTLVILAILIVVFLPLIKKLRKSRREKKAAKKTANGKLPADVGNAADDNSKN